MQGNAVRDMAFKKIEEKLMTKGINLAILDNEELAAVAVQFTGEAPPEHLPRETVIEILSGQESVQNWATSVREKVASNATAVAKERIRSQVNAAQSKTNSRIKNDPVAAQMAERFGVWIKQSGFTSTQLTQMLDSNADGFISSEEATNLIRNLSNSEPPAWVITHVLKVMDSNGDGQLSVPEWWEFLESIGLEVDQKPPADEFDELEQEILADAPAEQNGEEIPVGVIDEAELLIAEAEAEARKKVAEEKAKAEEAQAAQKVEAEQPPDEVIEPSPSDSMPNQNVVQEESSSDKSSTELTIEQLEKTRLSSESASVIEQSLEHTCIVTVEEVSRTLLGSGQYRGGCTIQGKIDGGLFSAGIMFPVSENELIESFKQGILITCQGKIAKWSSGSRQATLEGRNPVFD